MVSLRQFRAICTICAFLAGCMSAPVGGDFCAVERPIRLSEATIDAMSDQEVKDALAHDRKGEKLCGWKP